MRWRGVQSIRKPVFLSGAWPAYVGNKAVMRKQKCTSNAQSQSTRTTLAADTPEPSRCWLAMRNFSRVQRAEGQRISRDKDKAGELGCRRYRRPQEQRYEYDCAPHVPPLGTLLA